MNKIRKIEVGDKFNMLTVIEEISPRVRLLKNNKKESKRRFKCKCDCGNVCESLLIRMTTGHKKSCGCLGINNINQTKHGLHKHPLNYIWVNMKQRCTNKNSKVFKRYGGRGIKVCDEWKNSLESFYKWAMANGWKKGLQVDRYPDNNGNYEPSNCRITTPKLNSNNRRDNVIVLYHGQLLPLSLACDKVNLPLEKIRQYMKRNDFTFMQTIKYYGCV